MRFSFLVLLATVTLFSLEVIAPQPSYSTEEVKTFTVITRGTTKPFSYFDDDDKLTGFDVELLRLIEQKNPSVHFNFKTMSISAGYLALDSGQADLIANQMTKNPRNQDKYFFPVEPNNYTSTRLIVRENETEIKSIDDLSNKKVIMIAPSEFSRFMQEYDKEHNLGINAMHTDKGNEETFYTVQTGRADATGTYEYIFNAAKKEFGFKLKLVGPAFLSKPTFFTLRKSPETEKLMNTIDATLREFRADGTLKALSEKFFDGDYSTPQM